MPLPSLCLQFFSQGKNWLDFCSNGLLTTCISLWWYFVIVHQRDFDLSLRHDVYQTLNPQANYLALANDGNNLDAAWADFDRLQELVGVLDL